MRYTVELDVEEALRAVEWSMVDREVGRHNLVMARVEASRAADTVAPTFDDLAFDRLVPFTRHLAMPSGNSMLRVPLLWFFTSKTGHECMPLITKRVVDMRTELYWLTASVVLPGEYVRLLEDHTESISVHVSEMCHSFLRGGGWSYAGSKPDD
jgi:hypothetical protein